MKNTRVLAFATIAAVALAVVVPAASATAATAKTGGVVVQVISPTKKVLKLRNVEVVLASKTSSYSVDRLTNSKGQIVLTKVPVGPTFTVTLYPGDNESYVQWSTSVKAVWKKTVKVSAMLPKGGTLKGTLTADGHPLAGAAVAAMTSCSAEPFQTTTNSAGAFSIVGVRAGSYRIVYNVHGGDMPTSIGYGEGYWKTSATWSGATVVKVASQTSKKAATAVAGLNGTVSSARSLTGTISGAPTDTSGEPVTFDRVEYSAASTAVPQCDDHSSPVGTGFTRHLAPGSYYVALQGSDGKTYYYTGNDKAPSTEENDKLAVEVSGTADTAITLSFTTATAN
jgi:hypothetical protein